MPTHRPFTAYAPLDQNEDYNYLSSNMASLITASTRCVDDSNAMVVRSKNIAANIIKAIDKYKLTRSRHYTKLSNFFSKIDRDINFNYLRDSLMKYHEDSSETEISYNPLGLALWVYIYLNSNDYLVRITNKSRMRTAIFTVLEAEFPLSTLKSLTTHLDNLFSDREAFLNDLVIESVHLQSFANSLIFKIILLSQRLNLVSQLLADITNAYVPPNVIQEADLPDLDLTQQLGIQMSEIQHQMDEIKEEVNTEINGHHIPHSENDYKQKDARSKQLFANKTLRHKLTEPIRKVSESKSDDGIPTVSIELNLLRK